MQYIMQLRCHIRYMLYNYCENKRQKAWYRNDIDAVFRWRVRSRWFE